jgi:fused signal recognition particle receptor
MFGFLKGNKNAPTATPAQADAAVQPPAPASASETARGGWLDRLKRGLEATRRTLNTPVTELFSRPKLDDTLYEELETVLLTADCGVAAATHLTEQLRATARRERYHDPAQLGPELRRALTELLAPLAQPLDVSAHRPFVIMLAGVNGAGKTTTIGKLARRFQSQGLSVLLAAGDTFRAAAREQLAVWAERNGVAVISQQSADPAAVIYDAVQAASARGIDIVLADTAGRLPTQSNLMEELRKVKRVLGKALPGAPHEVLLVLDGNTGQNALAQLKAFDAAIGVTGLVVTKLDGSARGGVLAAIAREQPRPIRYLGVGEGIDDLQPFEAREFVDALFD